MKTKNRHNNRWSTLYKMIALCAILFVSGCKKDHTDPIIETGTVTDVEGNVYKTVKIGNQWWMAENLNVLHYRQGDSIPSAIMLYGSNPDSLLWSQAKTGTCYTIGGNDSTSSNFHGKLYGVLYNWYAVADPRNLAPEGWHIPTDEEWKELEIYLGMQKSTADSVNWRGTNQGNKLKIQKIGKAVWNPSSDILIWGTNESQFSAVAGGCVMFTGILGSPGVQSTGYWWSSSVKDNFAWFRYLDYQKPNVFRLYGSKNYGFSVRCVKDYTVSE